jgi:hypothetical protein
VHAVQRAGHGGRVAGRARARAAAAGAGGAPAAAVRGAPRRVAGAAVRRRRRPRRARACAALDQGAPPSPLAGCLLLQTLLFCCGLSNCARHGP